MLNEFGEWEDEVSYLQRGEEARDSISNKLLRARRLFLHSIADDPAKRAAFEILTALPIDWDKAANMMPQDDEPWRKPKMRQPDMLLTAEDGWLGEFTHGPDKKVELLRDQRIVGRPGAGAGGMEGGGVMKVHQLTMEQAFRDAGSQHYRREREVRREGEVEREEREAAREWLRHVEAGRLG